MGADHRVRGGLAVGGAACSSDSGDSVNSGRATTSAENLSVGADGSDVIAAPRELNTLGCQAGPLDGRLGADTQGAIRRFQAAAGITVAGVVGPQTRAALDEAAGVGAPRCPVGPPPPEPPAPSGTPPCTDPAIRAGATASLLPGEQLTKLNPFRCALTRAVAAPTVTTTANPQGSPITVLMRWTRTVRKAVDRGVHCDSGTVPAAVRQQAGQPN